MRIEHTHSDYVHVLHLLNIAIVDYIRNFYIDVGAHSPIKCTLNHSPNFKSKNKTRD
jgi:hypothetical protein